MHKYFDCGQGEKSSKKIPSLIIVKLKQLKEVYQLLISYTDTVTDKEKRCFSSNRKEILTIIEGREKFGK
jgi:hypothetical protein